MKQQLTARKTTKTKTKKQAPAESETWQRPHTARPQDLGSTAAVEPPATHARQVAHKHNDRPSRWYHRKQCIQCRHQRPRRSNIYDNLNTIVYNAKNTATIFTSNKQYKTYEYTRAAS